MQAHPIGRDRARACTREPIHAQARSFLRALARPLDSRFQAGLARVTVA